MPKDSAAIEHVLNKHLTMLRNIPYQREVRQRQGFDLKRTSKENINANVAGLIAGSNFLEKHLVDSNKKLDLSEALSYAQLSTSKTGLLHEEAELFKFITQNITLQHCTLIKDIALGATLKSVRKRELEGITVDNSRTGNTFGRQKFVYFVTGVGDQVNASGLDSLSVCKIDLNKLGAHDPSTYNKVYISPHLSEFQTNTCSNPVLLGDTLVNIQFDGEYNHIIYNFRRGNGEITFEKTFHLNDFVFYGGEHVMRGISYRFIQFLRFVGNPYRQILLNKMNDKTQTFDSKLELLSEAMTALLPGELVLEAKIPDQLVLDGKYTKIAENSLLRNLSTVEDEKSFLGDLSGKLNSLLLELGEKEPALLSVKEPAFEQLVHTGIKYFLDSEVFNGPYIHGTTQLTGYLPTDLNKLLFKVIYSGKDEALPLFEWLLKTSFKGKQDGIEYYANANEKERTGAYDLVQQIINNRQQSPERKIEFFNCLYPYLTKIAFQQRFSSYVSSAAYESFIQLNHNLVVNHLLSLDIPPIPNHEFAAWLQLENNETLLEYLFIKHKLDINAKIGSHTWLEYALIQGYLHSVDWLIDHGAVLLRPLPKSINLSDDFKVKLNISENDPTTEVSSNAVAVIVTATNYEGEKYTIMGRRRVKGQVENRWSFPGGMIDDNETTIEAALRELKEETTLVVDPSKATIREVGCVPLHFKQENVDRINQIVFVHVDLGNNSLPSVWDDSDLAEVAAIRLSSCQKNNSGALIAYRNLPIRGSNAILLQASLEQRGINVSSIKNILFAETYLPKFIDFYLNFLDYIDSCLNENIKKDFFNQYPYYLGEIGIAIDDHDALSKLKEETQHLLFEQLSNEQIYKALNEETLKNVAMKVIDSGNYLLVTTFLQFSGYQFNSEKYYFDISKLINSKNYDILNLIVKLSPNSLKVSRWDDIEKDNISSLPTEIREVFMFMNQDHIVIDELHDIILARNTSDVSFMIESLKAKVKNNKEIMNQFKKEHILAAIITGDLDLLKLFLDAPIVNELHLDYSFTYDYGMSKKINCYETNVLKILHNFKKKEMVEFLYDRFPSLFEGEYQYILDDLAIEIKNPVKNSNNLTYQKSTFFSTYYDSSDSDDEYSSSGSYYFNNNNR